MRSVIPGISLLKNSDVLEIFGKYNKINLTIFKQTDVVGRNEKESLHNTVQWAKYLLANALLMKYRCT